MAKHFLNRPVGFDLETAKDTTERHTPSKVRVKKCLPFFTILFMLGGGTLFGLSVSRIPENYVGYYVPTAQCGKDCDMELYTEGVYFDVPWHGGTFVMVDISSKNLTLGSVDGKRNETKLALYNVISPEEYATHVHLYSDSVSKLQDTIISYVKNAIDSINENSTYTIYGLEFVKIFTV